MDVLKNLSEEQLKERLSTVEKEHILLNQKVDAIAQQMILTPQEEFELKKLRKMKLRKKDLMAHINRMLEE